MPLRFRDLAFAAINGLFIGLLTPIIFDNLGAKIPVPYFVFALAIAIICVIGVAVGYFIASRIEKLHFVFQLAKFGLVGVTNTIVDIGIFNVFIFLTDIATGNIVLGFKFVSVNAAIINSYVWNKFWSFGKKNQQTEEERRKELTHFWLVSVVGLVLNAGITWAMVNLIGAQGSITDKAWATVASACASIAVLTWNFLGYKFFVFKK